MKVPQVSFLFNSQSQPILASLSSVGTEATIILIGGTVAGVTVLIVALLIMATAVWVARKKYKGQGLRSNYPLRLN